MGAVAAEVLVEAMIDKNALREHVFAQGFRDQHELDGLVRAHIRPVRDVAQVLATLAGGLMGSPHAAMTTSRNALDNNTPVAQGLLLAQRLGLLTVGTAASVMLKDKIDEEGAAAKGDGGSKKSGDEPPKDPRDPKAPRAAAAAAAASSARPKPGERAPASRPSEPKLPPKRIVDQGGVKVEHYTRSGDHGPAHLHVKGGGREVKIGQNGKPIKGEAELTQAQRRVVSNNIAEIRKALRQIQKWHRYSTKME